MAAMARQSRLTTSRLRLFELQDQGLPDSVCTPPKLELSQFAQGSRRLYHSIITDLHVENANFRFINSFTIVAFSRWFQVLVATGAESESQLKSRTCLRRLSAAANESRRIK